MQSQNRNQCNWVKIDDMLCHEKIIIECNDPQPNKNTHTKRKKKNSNRRKRQKLKEKLKQAEVKLENIIAQIYTLESNFDKKYQEIDECLAVCPNEDHFYDFINYVIRNQVEAIAKRIHACTRTISQLDLLEKENQPKLAIELYTKIQMVMQASPEIQKIINLFASKNEDDPQTQTHNLNLSTLKFISDTDKNKIAFQNACKRQLIISDDQRYKALIQKILKLFDEANEYEESDDEYDSDEYTVSSERAWQQLKALQERQRLKKKKKKKRKEKEDLSYTEVIKRLENLHINRQNRSFCHASEEWMFSLFNKFSH